MKILCLILVRSLIGFVSESTKKPSVLINVIVMIFSRQKRTRKTQMGKGPAKNFYRSQIRDHHAAGISKL